MGKDGEAGEGGVGAMRLGGDGLAAYVCLCIRALLRGRNRVVRRASRGLRSI